MRRAVNTADSTDTLLNKLVYYTVSTGAITVLCSIIVLIVLRRGSASAFVIMGTAYGGGESRVVYWKGS